jgi:ribose 5-phosphate isomerase B
MRIALGCDHRGFEGKRHIAPLLKKWGHEVHDFGCKGVAPCDYPDYAGAVAKAVASGEYDVGVLLDGSGIGMSVAANKVVGVRAALVHDEVTARLAREYNHCNVLCIGTDLLSDMQLKTIIHIFLTSTFAEGRHVRRVAKVCQLEAESIREARELLRPAGTGSLGQGAGHVARPVTRA